MKQPEFRSNMFLLLAAIIWGFAFVAQRIGAQYLGSFTFNGIRFALGSLSLVPLLIYNHKKTASKDEQPQKPTRTFPAGLITGLVLFSAASLQQIGLVESSAGKTAFITGLYIVIVPIMGIFLKHRTHINTWIGVIVATIGLYFLTVTATFTIANSDLLVLIGAVLWAVHILAIDHFSQRIDTLKLCIIQFITCSLLSLTAALIFENITLHGIRQAFIPILYGGICSVGIAYTLQVFGQKHAKPAHAAIILSMETVFATLGGWLILSENLGNRGYLGCLLMLSGMMVSQLPNFRTNRNHNESINSV